MITSFARFLFYGDSAAIPAVFRLQKGAPKMIILLYEKYPIMQKLHFFCLFENEIRILDDATHTCEHVVIDFHSVTTPHSG